MITCQLDNKECTDKEAYELGYCKDCHKFHQFDIMEESNNGERPRDAEDR
jgi:nitrate/TMAO reductase-like tetraheme cytochrome c subunit